MQFLGESLILAGLGGLAGVALGAAITAAFAWYQGWAILIPTVAVAGGLGAALLIGAIAGLAWVVGRERQGIMTGGQYTATQMLWYFVVGIWPILYTLVYL